MKKFLSLALALVMTLSLVTISAGATEYKDFTDRDEIQYEEAVAVLNRLGIITGYSEGDFRPEGELTRGAAAKIIVSLLIGPEAAEALPTTGNPYPDVPAGNVFAGYISFCKTQEIISGYGDGTFRPNGTLTGFAFAKMLLGALGYDSDIEGFTGSGWTMNVATLGNSTGLFDRLSFKGGDTVNRETACQLALNTLKATMVKYTGGSNITVSGSQNTNVTVNTEKVRSYVTSNQDFATNIKGADNVYRNDGNGTGNDRNLADWYTVEFGEEHFVDLRLEHSKYSPTEDKFGRPSVEWSYKRVTIGTYPLEADYTYTTQVAHNVPETTAAAKVRALGLGDYKVTANTEFYLNGRSDANADLAGALVKDGKFDVSRIADWTDNGALVEVYISYKNADEISHVVVSQSQLMEVKRIGSEAVSLQMYDNNAKPDQNVNRDDGNKNNDGQSGYNQDAVYAKIEDVESGDDYFSMLSGMKSGDLVVVVPVAKNAAQNVNDEYEVGEAYVPESVSGAFTNVTTHGATGSDKERRAIAVTVGGTKYNISQWHNEELGDANSDTLKTTRGDVTLHLDKYGNAIMGENFGDSSGWLIVGAFRQTLTDGRLTTLVTGWNEKGEKLELNLGPITTAVNGSVYVTSAGDRVVPGDLVKYTSNTGNSTTDWKIHKNAGNGVFNVYTEFSDVANEAYSVKASNPNIRLYSYNDGKGNASPAGNPFGVAKMDGTVKFVFVNFDEDGEVSSVNVQSQTNVSNAELLKTNPKIGGGSAAQAGVADSNDTSKANTKVVVIKNDYTDVNSLYLGYVSKYIGQATLANSITSTQNDAAGDPLTASNLKNDNRVVHEYTAILRNSNGQDGDEITIYSYDRLNPGDFFYWTKRDVEGFNNFYDLRRPNELTGRNTTVMWATLQGLYNNDKNVIRVQDYIYSLAANDNKTIQMYPAVATEDMSSLDNGEFANTLNVSGAVWHDLTNNRINNATDLKSYLDSHETRTVELRMVVNDNPESDGFRDVYLIVIEGTPLKTATRLGKVLPADELPIYAYNTQKLDDGTEVKAPLKGAALPGDPVTVTMTGDAGWTVTVVSEDGTEKTYTAPEKPVMKVGDKVTLTLDEGYEATVDGEKVTSPYEWEVTKNTAAITVTKPGEEPPAEEGNITVRMAKDTLGSVTGKVVDVFKTKATVNFNLSAPDWVYLASGNIADTDVTGIKYKVYVNDQAIDSGTYTLSTSELQVGTGNTLELKSGEEFALALGSGTTAAEAIYLQNTATDLTKDTVVIEITDVSWKDAKVEYVDEQGETVKMSAAGPAKLAVGTTGNLSFTLDSSYYTEAGNWSVTGAKADASTGTAPGAASLSGATTVSDWIANGGEKVVVTISGLKVDENRKYAIEGIGAVALLGKVSDTDKALFGDADAQTAALAGNLNIAVAETGDDASSSSKWIVKENGGSATLTFALSGTNSAVASWTVSVPVTKNGSAYKTYEKTLTDSTPVNVDILTMDGDYAIDTANIKVVPAKAFTATTVGTPTVDSATNNVTVVFTFSNDVSTTMTAEEVAACFTPAPNTVKVTEAKVNGATVTVTFSGIAATASLKTNVTIKGLKDVNDTEVVESIQQFETSLTALPKTAFVTLGAKDVSALTSVNLAFTSISIKSGDKTDTAQPGDTKELKEGDEITFTLTVTGDGLKTGTGNASSPVALSFAEAASGVTTIKGTNCSFTASTAVENVTGTAATNKVTFTGTGLVANKVIVNAGSTFTITYELANTITDGASYSIALPTWTPGFDG